MNLAYRVAASVFHRLPLPSGKLARSRDGRLGAAARWVRWARESRRAEPLIWVHGASVGEVQVTAPIVMRLRARYPSMQIVQTYSSSSMAGWPLPAGIDRADFAPAEHPVVPAMGAPRHEGRSRGRPIQNGLDVPQLGDALENVVVAWIAGHADSGLGGPALDPSPGVLGADRPHEGQPGVNRPEERPHGPSEPAARRPHGGPHHGHRDAVIQGRQDHLGPEVAPRNHDRPRP